MVFCNADVMHMPGHVMNDWNGVECTQCVFWSDLKFLGVEFGSWRPCLMRLLAECIGVRKLPSIWFVLLTELISSKALMDFYTNSLPLMRIMINNCVYFNLQIFVYTSIKWGLALSNIEFPSEILLQSSPTCIVIALQLRTARVFGV